MSHTQKESASIDLAELVREPANERKRAKQEAGREAVPSWN